MEKCSTHWLTSERARTSVSTPHAHDATAQVLPTTATAKILSLIQLRDPVISPSLDKIGFWSRAAEDPVLGTALVESVLTYLKQHGGGLAMGLWQIDPTTNEDLYTNFLKYRLEFGSKHMELRTPNLSMVENPATNRMYGAAVCR